MDGDLGKLAAASLGVGLCLFALSAWGLPTSGSPPGLDLRLIAVPPGELTVDPTGVIASERAMQAAGGAAGGRLRVENIAGRPLLVSLAALPSTRSLARKVRLRATVAGKTIASGTLAALDRPQRALRLPARGSRWIAVSAWIPPGASGYRGGVLDVTLDLRARPLETGG